MTYRPEQVDSVFLREESGEESVGKKVAGNFGYRTDSLNNHQDYSANQPGIQITGAFFLYGLFTISTHRKRSPLCRPFCTVIQ